MLKIIRVPDESTFTEADLKPGLRVIRKSDGAEVLMVCCMNSSSSRPWMFVVDGSCIVGIDGYFGNTDSDALAFLNRDFRRAEEHPQYRTVGEVPPGVVFEMGGYGPVLMLGGRRTETGNLACFPFRRLRIDSWPDCVPVTRVHGRLVWEGV